MGDGRALRHRWGSIWSQVSAVGGERIPDTQRGAHGRDQLLAGADRVRLAGDRARSLAGPPPSSGAPTAGAKRAHEPQRRPDAAPGRDDTRGRHAPPVIFSGRGTASPHRSRAETTGEAVPRPLLSLRVVIEEEFVRVRPHPDGGDVARALHGDPRLDDVTGEHAALRQEGVVALQRLEHLLERPGRALDRGAAPAMELVEVLIDRGRWL